MSTSTAYDQVAYPVGTIACSHPRRLGVLGQIFGLAVAPVERCRVLELGCGQGANLLPMAEALPGSTFLGIDLAAAPIAQGEALRARLQLQNLTLRAQDVLDFEPEPEGYDYVIAHGLFSWVPPPVQERIFAVIRRALAPRGVAYVSYYTLPGAHLRRPLRELMRFHAGRVEDPKLRVAKARAIAGFVAGNAPESAAHYKRLMEWQRDRIGTLEDNYLFHDDLSEAWEPLYFHEFMARAGRHGLAYLADANYEEMQDQRFPEEVRRVLRASDDIVLFEQYLDFLVGRTFRRTLLVREGETVDRALQPERLRPLFFSAAASPVPGAPGRFRNDEGTEAGLPLPLGQAALHALHDVAPAALSYDELLAVAGARLRDAERGEDAGRELGQLLLALYAGRMVRVHAHRPAVASGPSERPRATRLARQQAEAGLEVTDLWHEHHRIEEPLARFLLKLCDGTRDRAALRAALGEVRASGVPLSEEALLGRIEDALQGLARRALLEA